MTEKVTANFLPTDVGMEEFLNNPEQFGYFPLELDDKMRENAQRKHIGLTAFSMVPKSYCISTDGWSTRIKNQEGMDIGRFFISDKNKVSQMRDKRGWYDNPNCIVLVEYPNSNNLEVIKVGYLELD